MKPITDGRPVPAHILPGDVELTAADIIELGLEEAPEDLGPSWQEIADAKLRRANHG